MKILPNTQRLGKLTFDSNQVRKSSTNPNVLIVKASDGKDYGVVRKSDGSYDFAGSTRNLSLKDRLIMGVNQESTPGGKLYSTASTLLSEPQRMMTRALTGNKYNSPSEFIQDSKLPKNLKNTVGLASDMIADPSNLVGIGVGAKAAKLAMMLPAIPALAKSSKVISKIGDVMQSFKSEANWNKWNPETLKRPDLLEEYNTIEKTSKADGTWLKSIDGKPWNPTKEAKELGLEKEQYISQASKSFKKAYPEGFDLTYRGAKNVNPELRMMYNKDIKDNNFNAIFTANEALAETYIKPKTLSVKPLTPTTNISNPKNILTVDKVYYNESGEKIIPLIHPKGNNLDINVLGDGWQDLNKNMTKDDILEEIKNYEDIIKREMKNIDANYSSEVSKNYSWDKIENASYYKNLLNLKLKNFDNITNNKEEFNKLKTKYGNAFSTREVAEYLDNHPTLNKINLENINDNGLGDVTIVKHKPGHFLKSSIGNVGDYDMNNPNIYKGIVPGAIAAGAAASTMSNKDKNNKFKYGGKLLPLLNKF